MAVRTINYTVNENGVSPETSQWGGIQYENNATRVAYTLEQNFKEKLQQNYPNGELFVYRIDFDSSVAGYQPSENIEAVDGVISRDIPLVITASGEPFQSTLVITVLDAELNEIGTFCSKPTRIYFNSISREQYSEEELTSSISAMAEAVTKMHEQVLTSAADADSDAKTAHEAMLKTEQAKLSLESGSEFVFLGGDAQSAMDIELVVDEEISDKSENLVKNKVIAAAINDTKRELRDYTDSKTGAADFIVEQGVDNGWTYRKWNSGMFEAWFSQVTSEIYTTSAAGAIFSTEVIRINPPTLAVVISNVHCNCGFTGWYSWSAGWAENGQSICYQLYTTADISGQAENIRTIRQYIYITGTWKQEG